MAVGSSTHSSKVPSARQELITKVVQVYGAPDDAELRGVAQGFLDDTIKEMNSHLYEFSKKKLTGVVLTENVQEYTLNDDVYKEHLAYIHHTVDDKNEAPMIHLPHAHFMDQWGEESRNAAQVPVVYTFRNLHGDCNILLAPAPAATIADEYTLTVEYYRRIPLVSEDSQLDVPPEVQTALVYGAQKRMAIHIHADAAHRSVAALHLLEGDALRKLKAIDIHHPDTQKRFRLVDHSFRARKNFQRGEVYIRIK